MHVCVRKWMIGSANVLRVAGAAALSFALLARVASPAYASATEIQVLQKIPRVVLEHLEFDAKPDPKGAMQLNVGGWHAVVYQRIAVPLLLTGAVEGDASKIDDGWRAIDYAFAHQLSDGSFRTIDGKPTPPSEMSFWIEAVCHALLVVQESPLGNRYAARIAATKPKIAKALAWLERPANRKTLLLGDYYNASFFASGRLFIDAGAFMTASRLLGDPRPMVFARQFLAQALSRQTAGGVFPESGGFDPSGQGVSLVHATYYALRDPSAPGLAVALAKGVAREVRAVGPAGQVGTKAQAPTLDLRSIILGLYYSGIFLEDPAAVQAGGRVFKRTFSLEP